MVVLGGKCEPLIIFECMVLSIGQGVNMSGLSCVSNKVLRCWDSYKVNLFQVLIMDPYVSFKKAKGLIGFLCRIINVWRP